MKTALFLLALALAPIQAQTTIQAFGELPANTRDHYGDTIGGIGSGITYAGHDFFICTTDRGPGDGNLPYSPRCVTLQIEQIGNRLSPKIVDSAIYRDKQGRAMTGLIPDDPNASTPRMKDGRTCIDPEAIAFAPDNTIYVSDEYGPYLYQFQRDGRMIRRIALPEIFRPKIASGKTDFRASAPLVSGRMADRGAEGLCLLPGGKTAALIFQNGTIQDRGLHSPYTRIVLLNLATGKCTGMYLYPFATRLPGTTKPLKVEELSVNDMLALDATHFLVLERDGLGRNGTTKSDPARYKAVWLTDISHATNLLVHPTSPELARKTLLFNLPAVVAEPKKLSAKWEGITLMQPPKNGKVTLMMSADNDFLTPTIYDSGTSYKFSSVVHPVPSQFFKISSTLPQKNPFP
jgi:hypothetical protein